MHLRDVALLHDLQPKAVGIAYSYNLSRYRSIS